MKKILILSLVCIPNLFCQIDNGKSGNPIIAGNYADPEGAIFGNQYWIFPTSRTNMKNRFLWMNSLPEI